MQYSRCKCGKAELWHSGEMIHPCMGCEECQTTYGYGPNSHEPLQPHDYEQYFLGGKDPNPAKMCKRCHHIEREKK